LNENVSTKYSVLAITVPLKDDKPGRQGTKDQFKRKRRRKLPGRIQYKKIEKKGILNAQDLTFWSF